jgi:ferritin-like protein
MNALELKKDLHNLIDSTDNESLLSDFYALMKRRISGKEGKLWKRLSKEEQEELNLAFKESEKPENLISHEEMRKKHEKWL